MALLPLENDLTALVDDDLFPELSRYEWGIRWGRVRMVSEDSSWSGPKSLHRWIAKADPANYVLFRDGNRRNLQRANLAEVAPKGLQAFKGAHPVQGEVPVAQVEGTAWIPELQAWTAARFARNPSSPNAEFFPDEDEAFRFYQGTSELETVPFDFLADQSLFVPLHPSTSLQGRLKAPGRGAASASVIWLVLRSFTIKTERDWCIASQEAIARMIGCSKRTVSRGLQLLKDNGVIELSMSRESQVTREGNVYFRKWRPHTCNLKLQPTGEECAGRFPVSLFGDDRFLDLSFKAQAVLIALYSLAAGAAEFSFTLSDLIKESLLTRESVLTALLELRRSGLLVCEDVRGKRGTKQIDATLPVISESSISVT